MQPNKKAVAKMMQVLESQVNTTESHKEFKFEPVEEPIAERITRRTDTAIAILNRVLPPKFANVKFELSREFSNYIPPCALGLCLTGKSGIGKTTTMAMIVRDYFYAMIKDFEVKMSDKESWWKFISYPDFVMQIQDSFRHDGEVSAYQILKSMSRVPYLIIDDLGAEKPTDFVRQSTYYLINEREINLRQTFITTNFSLDYLDRNIDARIASRIAGMCGVVQLSGEDKRLLRK